VFWCRIGGEGVGGGVRVGGGGNGKSEVGSLEGVGGNAGITGSCGEEGEQGGVPNSHQSGISAVQTKTHGVHAKIGSWLTKAKKVKGQLRRNNS